MKKKNRNFLDRFLENFIIRTGEDAKTFQDPQLNRDTWFIAEQFAVLLSGLIVSSILAWVVFKIMSIGGLSAVFAGIMANACVNTGIPCDFNFAMGALGFSLILITSFAVVFVQMLGRDVSQFEVELELDEKEPCRHYNRKQIEMLRFIQAINGTENLLKVSNFLDLPYTTARNFVEQFERDGYVDVISNGKGSPVEIRLAKK